MNVSLTEELEAAVHAKVARGEYASASELVREALRLLVARDRRRALVAHLERLVAEGVDPGPPEGVAPEEWERTKARVLGEVRRKIEEGIASAERGGWLDGDEVMRELRARGRRLGSGRGPVSETL